MNYENPQIGITMVEYTLEVDLMFRDNIGICICQETARLEILKQVSSELVSLYKRNKEQDFADETEQLEIVTAYETAKRQRDYLNNTLFVEAYEYMNRLLGVYCIFEIIDFYPYNSKYTHFDSFEEYFEELVVNTVWNACRSF